MFHTHLSNDTGKTISCRLQFDTPQITRDTNKKMFNDLFQHLSTLHKHPIYHSNYTGYWLYKDHSNSQFLRNQSIRQETFISECMLLMSRAFPWDIQLSIHECAQMKANIFVIYSSAAVKIVGFCCLNANSCGLSFGYL